MSKWRDELGIQLGALVFAVMLGLIICAPLIFHEPKPVEPETPGELDGTNDPDSDPDNDKESIE